MDNVRVRPRTRRRRSHTSTRPFRAAMRAMALGSLVLGIVALLHEDSPVARLLAERTTDEQNSHLPIAPDLGLIAPQQVPTVNRPRSVASPDARPGKDSGRYWNASHTRRDGRAAIQLGPLEDGASTSEGIPRAPIAGAAAHLGPVVTRTYRPTSMSAVSLERLVRPLLTARGSNRRKCGLDCC